MQQKRDRIFNFQTSEGGEENNENIEKENTRQEEKKKEQTVKSVQYKTLRLKLRMYKQICH